MSEVSQVRVSQVARQLPRPVWEGSRRGGGVS